MRVHARNKTAGVSYTHSQFDGIASKLQYLVILSMVSDTERCTAVGERLSTMAL
jgi:hypothetical protein